MRDLGIADRLRARGLHVVEVDGWRERGSATFQPRGSVDHHTAGSPTGDAPSLGICINGRAGLPGPLCNVLVSRSNRCFVIAAGRANHAGTGGWAGLSGNSSVYGVERENVGTTAEPWRPDQTVTAGLVHAALLWRPDGSADPSLVCEHKEWAPRRKIDAHTIAGAELRALVASYLGAAPPPIRRRNAKMLLARWHADQAVLLFFAPKVWISVEDGADYDEMRRSGIPSIVVNHPSTWLQLTGVQK